MLRPTVEIVPTQKEFEEDLESPNLIFRRPNLSKKFTKNPLLLVLYNMGPLGESTERSEEILEAFRECMNNQIELVHIFVLPECLKLPHDFLPAGKYRHFLATRATRRGGGISLYVDKTIIDYDTKKSGVEGDSASSINIRVKFRGQAFSIAGLYIPPIYPAFLEVSQTIIEELVLENKGWKWSP